MNKTPSKSFWLRTGGARTLGAAAIAFIATTAITGIAIAHTPFGWRPPGIVAVRIAAVAPAIVADSVTIPRKARCTVCGVVESVLPAEGPAAAVEFRVRMQDSTLRTSAAADAGRWQAGDAIMLIGPCVRQRTDSAGSAAHAALVDPVIRPVSSSPGCPSHHLEPP